jgi:hypothetical protein
MRLEDARVKIHDLSPSAISLNKHVHSVCRSDEMKILLSVLQYLRTRNLLAGTCDDVLGMIVLKNVQCTRLLTSYRRRLSSAGLFEAPSGQFK